MWVKDEGEGDEKDTESEQEEDKGVSPDFLAIFSWCVLHALE
jgi:hypothetical protein